jgi:CheY-like chemotaxis protein
LNRIQDINKKLIEVKAKAEGANMLKSAFLANMSHEIRTPMNAIMGFSGLLMQQGLSTEKIQDYAQIINNSTNQLLGIISDIIDISKIETGQIFIDLEMVNINQLINELFITYQKIIKPKNISFKCSCELPNTPIQVKTDGNRIKQVFCNLLNNAIKFTKEGEIEFGYNVKGNFVEFFVKDTGMGISKENYELIFERFRQLKKTNDEIYGGNGLGLSISKALIEKLGGSITVYSELDKGSIFKFTIPYLEGNEIDIASKETTKTENFDWNDKTILIVDDDQYSYTFLKELLLDSNANLVHAWNGKEAGIQVKNNSDISVVLMDIKMPYMDGYEATRIIKQLYPKLPVIAQTAFALTQEKKRALKAGCDNYLSKPIDIIHLKNTINSYLSDIKVIN